MKELRRFFLNSRKDRRKDGVSLWDVEELTFLIKKTEKAPSNVAIWDEFSEQHKHKNIKAPYLARLALFNANKAQI